MEPLSRRAAEIRTELRGGKLRPMEIERLEREYNDLVDKRMKIIKGEITSQDECMGYGSVVGEAGPRPEDIPAYLRKQQGQKPLTPGQVKAPRPDTLSDPKNLNKNIGDRNEIEEGQYEIPKEFLYVIDQIRDGYESGKPYEDIKLPDGQIVTMTRESMFNLLASFSKMTPKQIKKIVVRYFDKKHNFLTLMGSPTIKRFKTPPLPKPVKDVENPDQIPLGLDDTRMSTVEARGQKKNSKEVDTPYSSQVQRYLKKVRAAAPNATSDLEAIAKDELEKGARINKNIDDLEKVNARQDAALKKAMTLDRQQNNELSNIENQIDQLSAKVQGIRSAKPSATSTQTANGTPVSATKKADTDGSTKSDKKSAEQPATGNPESAKIVYIAQPESLPAKDQELYSAIKRLETEIAQKTKAVASWAPAADQDPKSRNELAAMRKDLEQNKKDFEKSVVDLETRLGKSITVNKTSTAQEIDPQFDFSQYGQAAEELPAQSELPPTDFSNLPTAKVAKAPAKKLSYKQVPQAATAKSVKNLGRKQPAVPTGATVQETSADQFGQAIDQVTGTGKQLRRDPEIRRLKQVKDYEMMLKKELANRIQDRDAEDDEQDFQDISESNIKRLLSNLNDMTDAEFLERYKKPKQYWRNQMTAQPATGNIADLDSDIDTARVKPTFDRAGRMVKARGTPVQQGMKRMLGKPKATRPAAELNPVEVTMQVPNRKTDQYDLLPARIFNNETEAREFARRVNGHITSMKPVVHEGYQDFKKPEPYAVCLAGKPVKQFDYYEQARQFHDNWKKKLYREGNTEKADKITLMPVMDEAADMPPNVPQAAIVAPAPAAKYQTQKPQAPQAQALTSVDDPSWDRVKERIGQRIKTQREINRGASDVIDVIKNVAGPNAKGEYLVTIVNNDNVKQYVTKNPPADMMKIGSQSSASPSHPKVSPYSDDASTLKVYKPEQYRDVKEAGNPAQQAAIAINMKKTGKKPKHVDEHGGGVNAMGSYVAWRKNANKERGITKEDAIPGKMVTQGFVVEYDPATRTTVISKRGQELDRFGFKGQPNLISFQRTVAKRVKELEDDLYGADQEPGVVSLSRMKVPARGHGYQELGEDASACRAAAEEDILKRIMVAHRDLMVKFGPEKVANVVEDICYNIGDQGMITDQEVDGWVHQVRQILGAEWNFQTSKFATMTN